MPREDDYRTARTLALETLAQLDLDKCCINAGLLAETISPGKQRVTIPYVGRAYDLNVSDAKISFDEGARSLKISDQVVLLHYLITATGTPFQDKWITFREVPSGSFYYPAFLKRAVIPLVNCFGQTPELLERVAGLIGRVAELPGDRALEVRALPRVPVVLSLWKGDNEFPPEGNIFFDASISSYLPTEDIAYLAGAVVYKVINMARNM
jgi:hypothetical protein